MENNDISAALGKLLEDPAALSRVMSMASTLMGNVGATSASSSGEDAQPTSAEPSAHPDIPSQASEETAPLSPTSVDQSAPSIAALAQVLGGGGGKGDPRCALLYALKPYMGHGRAEKIDTLVNMLRLADLAGGLLGGKLF